MGGKGGTAPPAAAPVAQDNSMAMMGMMMQMMEMNNSQQQMPMPQMLEAPDVETTTPIDWATQMEDLNNKARYDAEAEDRKGRMATIHSSLTDEGEETEMSASLLGTE